MYSEHTLRKRVIRATFIVCNKKLYQISSHGLKIKSTDPPDYQFNQKKFVLIVHLHQAHHTQITAVPEKYVSCEPNGRES